jgi:hypothetical protein
MSTFWLPGTLPFQTGTAHDLDVIKIVKTVRGSQKNGRAPYVQYHRVRYTSPLLASTAELIGAKLTLHIRRKDLRHLTAYYADGSKLGILQAGQGWAKTRHNLALRKHIFREMDDGTLSVAPGTDPVFEAMHAKSKQAVQDVKDRKGKRPKISRSATWLASATLKTDMAIPPVDDVSPFNSDRREEYASKSPSNSSLVPQVTHRGLVK